MITCIFAGITQKRIPLIACLLIFASISSFSVLLAGNTEGRNFSNFNAALWYRGVSPAQEIITARTLNTKVFALENGNFIYRIFSRPVHGMTEQGTLEDLSDSCTTCDNWQVGESYGGYADGLFEELNVCGQSATYIQVNETYFLRGFVEFNTDAVPDTAIIDSLILSLNCVQWPVYSEDHDIWSMESRPSTSSAMGVYYDAMDGDCYVDDYLGGTGWNSWELDSVAIQKFVDLLADDWFAVGISDFTSASAYYLLYQCSSGYIDVIELGIEEEKPQKPPTLVALEIKPNPFSSAATITLTIPGAQVHKSTGAQEKNELNIYNISGRLVRSFVLPTPYSVLHTAVVWDGRDAQGNPLPSGTYFCKLNLGDATFTKKMMLIR